MPSFLRSSRPRLVVLLLACLVFAAACARPIRITHSAGAPGLPGTATERQIELDLLDRVNMERAARGLNRVTLDPNLANNAYAWSFTMAAQNSMYHSNLLTWISPYVAVAENIAWETSPPMTAGDMHVMWMRSDPHRHNVLAPNLTHIGIGVACVNGRMWGTERFGSTWSPDFGALPPVSPIVRADRGALAC